MYQDQTMTGTGAAHLSSEWEPVHKCSLWDGHGTCETFSLGYWKKVENDNKPDYYKVKLHRKRIDDAGLPNDLAGWELFASKDQNVDGSIGQATIEKDWNRGRHRVLKVPATDAALFYP